MFLTVYTRGAFPPTNTKKKEKNFARDHRELPVYNRFIYSAGYILADRETGRMCSQLLLFHDPVLVKNAFQYPRATNTLLLHISPWKYTSPVSISGLSCFSPVSAATLPSRFWLLFNIYRVYRVPMIRKLEVNQFLFAFSSSHRMFSFRELKKIHFFFNKRKFKVNLEFG